MKKMILLATAILLAGAAGAGWYFWSNLESIVEGLIEDQGSQVTRTSVGVSGVEIELGEARAGVAGLGVANPDGFGSDDALSLDDIVVELDPGSLREGPIVLREVRVRAPVVRVQFREDGSSNLGRLKEHIDSWSGGNGGDEPGRPVRIDRFELQGGRIEVDASALGVQERTLELPPLVRQQVGGPGGTEPAAIAQELLGAVAREALAAIGRSELEQQLRERVGDGVVDETKGLLDKLGGG